FGEESLRLVGDREVVVLPTRDEGLVPRLSQPLDEAATEKTPAAGDEDVHRAGSAALPTGSQSTRPIQRSRLAAYPSIVRATPCAATVRWPRTPSVQKQKSRSGSRLPSSICSRSSACVMIVPVT